VSENILELEKRVLGQLMFCDTSKATVFKALLALRARHFTSRHAAIFEAIGAVSRRGDPVDEVTVAEELRATGKLDAAGGAAYVAGLNLGVEISTNVLHHVEALRQRCASRDMLSMLGDAAAEIRDGADPMKALAGLTARAQDVLGDRDAHTPIAQAAQNVLGELLGRLEGRDKGRGLKTGYRDVDAIVGAMMPGSLNVIGASPGSGKTAFGLGVAQNAASTTGKRVLVYSAEMLAEELSTRVMCSLGNVSSEKVRDAATSQAEFERLAWAKSELEKLRIDICDRDITVERMALEVQMASAQNDLALVVIDYLQLIETEMRTDSRYQAVSHVSRSLKRLARSAKVPILALSQLNRAADNRKDGRPCMSDLRDSGQIGQDADLIVLLHRDPEVDSVIEVDVAKQRNGQTGRLKMKWVGRYTRFEDY
jgi:replicative DNA helicase